MRIKITKPDGTVIEAEGTAEECAKLMGEAPTPYFVPYIAPTYVPWWQPPFTYTVTGDTVGATATTFTGAS